MVSAAADKTSSQKARLLTFSATDLAMMRRKTPQPPMMTSRTTSAGFFVCGEAVAAQSRRALATPSATMLRFGGTLLINVTALSQEGKPTTANSIRAQQKSRVLPTSQSTCRQLHIRYAAHAARTGKKKKN